jgi:hypothetical protein
MGSQQTEFRILLKKGYQRELLLEVSKKLGLSQRKFAKELNVSRRCIRNWMNETRIIPEYIFRKLTKIIPEALVYKSHVISRFPSNWGQIKGGRVRAKSKNNFTMKGRIKGFRIANTRTIKRKVIGPLGERMYNEGERKIAEFLLNNKLKYTYEPIIILGNTYAFPDFKVNEILIERCGYSDWNGYWMNILKKLKLYEKYCSESVLIIVPPKNFKKAIKRLKMLENVIIIKENDLDLILRFIGPKGP